MVGKRFACGLGALALLVGAASGRVAADDVGTVEDVILLLQERGVIEEADATRIVERNREYEKKETWADRIEVFGDFRGRYENFWYDRDPTGNEKKNRSRIRYRLRFGARTQINDHFDLAFRLATGTESRTRNQTVGDGVDFLQDVVSVDYAYLTYHPFLEDSIPFGGRTLDVLFGKVPNPFRSDVGKDFLVWDADITPEGIAATYEIEPCEGVDLTFNLAYFVDDENATDEDPAVIPVQLGMTARSSDDVTVGGRLSYYAWRHLDGVSSGSNFFMRGESSGNIPGGLADDDSVDIGDLRLWMRYSGIEDWPILVYGRILKNFSAEAMPAWRAGREDLGWSVGFEVGDKKKVAALGAGYFWIEANAVPGQMTDSDIFDGHTNGKGWGLFGTKQIYPNTDLKFELLIAEALDDDITWGPAVEGSDRVRLRTDVYVKF